MLLVLFFFTGPLADVPNTALAAVIMVSAVGLLDIPSWRDLFQTSHREFFLSVITTLGVLVLGALPGVILTVGLTLLWLLTVAARPHGAILGKVPGLKGLHDILDYPNARTIDGLLLYRLQGNLVFFNADYFKENLLASIATSKTPVEWVVVDASPVNIVDATALQKLDEIRTELEQEVSYSHLFRSGNISAASSHRSGCANEMSCMVQTRTPLSRTRSMPSTSVRTRRPARHHRPERYLA
jgi:sulfate permease, SulP family